MKTLLLLVFVTNFWAYPSLAQTWPGADYGVDENSLNEEQRLRKLYEEQAIQTTPPFQTTPSVPSSTGSSEPSPDKLLQAQPHLLPGKIEGAIPTAVYDPQDDLVGTNCYHTLERDGKTVEFYRGRGVIVDLSEQRAYVYEPELKNQSYTCKLIKSFRVTTAKNGKITPTGSFYLAQRERTNVAGYTIDWMTFTYENNGFWGIHPAPWQKGNFGEEWYRKANGSLGCVRVDPGTWTREVRPLLFTNIAFRIQP